MATIRKKEAAESDRVVANTKPISAAMQAETEPCASAIAREAAEQLAANNKATILPLA